MSAVSDNSAEGGRSTRAGAIGWSQVAAPPGKYLISLYLIGGEIRPSDRIAVTQYPGQWSHVERLCPVESLPKKKKLVVTFYCPKCTALIYSVSPRTGLIRQGLAYPGGTVGTPALVTIEIPREISLDLESPRVNLAVDVLLVSSPVVGADTIQDSLRKGGRTRKCTRS